MTGRRVVYVHIATVTGDRRLADAWSGLEPDERRRASAFRRQADADRWVLARALLRDAVAAHLGCGPDGVTIEHASDGAPLVGGDHRGRVRCSLSHAGERVIVAVTAGDGPPIGVDVEPIDVRRADVAVARRFLPSDVVEDLHVIPEADRPRRIAAAWTRLEAEAKGRRRPLDALAGQPRSGTFTELPVGPDHVATLWTDAAASVRLVRP